jgi:hypothetical protein
MSDKSQRRMTRAEWSKTPYAKSDARDPDGAILSLLAKYKITTTQLTHGNGPNGRPAFAVRFMLGERAYTIMRETLHADAPPDQLLKQVKRAIYYRLKVTLEDAAIFPPEEVLFPYLELPAAGGVTVYTAAQPALAQFKTPDFGRLMLPPKETNED